MRASRRPATGLTIASGVLFALTVSAQQPRQVDDALLLKPPPEAWIGHGRDYAETHHSPLARIDQSNVARLTEAWSVDVGSQGKIETTPIVWNGTLYGTSTWSVVYAVDARTGALKWRWDPALVKGGLRRGRPALLLRAGQPRCGHLQGPGLRRPARRPAGRARRRHRPGGVVGADHAGRQRLQHHRRAAHRQRQGRHRQRRR